MRYNLKKLIALLKEQDISSRTFFITGGNSGFGYLTAKTILTAGGCRSEEKAKNACNQLKEESGHDAISYLLIDMENPKSIIDCVKTIGEKDLHIHVLVNNAGVSMINGYQESPTGIEKTCQTNYIGLVQLTELLTPLLEKEENPRVINISSLTYVKGGVTIYDPEHIPLRQEEYERFWAYYRSKYLVTSYTQYYSRHHPKVYTVACDPGIAGTNIARELGCIGWIYSRKIFQIFAPAWKGACTITYACASDEIKTVCQSGELCCKCNNKKLIPQVQNVDEQEKIHALTMEIIESITKTTMNLYICLKNKIYPNIIRIECIECIECII